MKLIRTVTITAIMLLGCITEAQEQTSSTPSLPSADGPSIALTRAVVVRYDHDGTIELQESGKKAKRVKLAVQPLFLGHDGKLIEPQNVNLKPGVKVLVHYMPDGDLMIVDRIILE
jgi:hypothetical protein